MIYQKYADTHARGTHRALRSNAASAHALGVHLFTFRSDYIIFLFSAVVGVRLQIATEVGVGLRNSGILGILWKSLGTG